MSMLAILGHESRGKEVIEILEMLGGNNLNNHYPDGIQPISIFDGKYSRTWHEAVERKNRKLRHIVYCRFLSYVDSRGWKIKMKIGII